MLIDRYRQAGLRAGHSPDQLKVGIHSLGYVAASSTTAANEFFPGYAQSFTEGISPTACSVAPYDLTVAAEAAPGKSSKW